MSYWANPFDSKPGYEVLMTTFKSLFVDNNNKIIDDSMSRSVKHFVDDFFLPGIGRGASAIRTQAVSYDTIDPTNSQDSGIYGCPCGRIGYLWDWEYLDFSVYDDGTWDKMATKLTAKGNGMYGGKGYRIMAQVRCNEVSICTRCGVTYMAPEMDLVHCPHCGTGPIEGEEDGQGMVQAGCGNQLWIEHEIPPVTEAQSFNFSTDWKSQKAMGHFVDLRKPKALTVKIPRRIGIKSFEIRWAGDVGVSWKRRQGTACKTRQEAMAWIPKLSLVLDHANAAGYGTLNSPLEFPISLFGGYSDKESILYPGRTAFGGSQLHVSKDPSQAGAPLYYFGGNRAPGVGGSSGISAVDGRKGGGFVVPLKYLSVQGIVRCQLLPSTSNPISWQEFTKRIFRFNSCSSWHYQNRLEDDVNSERMEFTAPDPGSGAHLPVYQFRTRQISGNEIVNLKDPGMRYIDDRGLLRVSVMRLNPIPTLPKEFDQDRPAVGSPIICPNDIGYAIDMQRQLVDNAGRFMERVRARIESVSRGTNLYDTRYPFGITPIAIPNPPPPQDLIDALYSFGFDIPAEPPGTGFSFLVTANRARAGVKVGNRNYPAFHRKSNGELVPWTDELTNLWDVPTNHATYNRGELVDYLFFTPGYGRGTRRDGTYSAPLQWPRFGSALVGREFIEDPYHAGSGFMPLNNLILHSMLAMGRPNVDISTMKKYQSFYCDTCASTLHQGSIVKVRENQSVVTDVELDAGGFPIRWIFIPGNRRGMAEWMVAAEAAYEGNRTMDFCPDPVRQNPDEPLDLAVYRFYRIPHPDGIEDFRYEDPMIFIREDELSGVSGYERHDQDEVVIDGVEYERPRPRSEYLLGPPNENPAGSPLSRSDNARIVSIVEADGPMRRSGFLNVPAIAGIGESGRAYTSGAVPMIDPRAAYRSNWDDDDDDAGESWWERDWESYDDGWNWGDDDRGFDPDEEFDPDDW